MKLTPNFYQDRLCLNVLAGSKANARAIWEAAEGHVLVGVLSKNYSSNEAAIADMRDYAALIDNALSVGLGAGDPNQSKMVSEISAVLQPQHVNALLKDMGGSSVKYFPMGGLKAVDEYRAVAQACAAHDFWLEPTGGIDLDNVEAILAIALEAGVSKIIPHVYSSIIDPASGDTRVEDVRQLLAICKKLLP